MRVVEPFIWIAYDLLAVSIFFYFVYRCARRGFVSTVVGLLIYVVAASAAAATYVKLAGFLYENVIEELVRHILTRNINHFLSESGGAARGLINAIPAVLRLLVWQKSGEVNVLVADEADSLANQVIELALKDPIMSILCAAGFLLVFAVASHIMRWLAGFFTGINNVPVIGFLNTVTGGIAGVIEGVLSLYVGGFIIKLAATASGGMLWWLNDSVIDQTYIWRLFY